MTSKNSPPVGFESDEALVDAVSNATPHRLVEMLYDGALERIAQAQRAMEQHDAVQRDELIDRAVAIVRTLNESLDRESQDEVTREAGLRYSNIILNLLEGQQFCQVELLQKAHRMLAELKASWMAIAPDMEAGD